MKKIIITSILISLFMPIASAQAATKSLQNKNNKVFCKDIKTKYKTSAMSNWSNGISNDEDVLKEINLNIIMLNEKQKKSSKSLQKIIKFWIKTEEDTKNALINKNIKDINLAMDSKIESIKKFNNFCKKYYND